MRASASRLPLVMSCAYPARDDVRVPESTSPAGDRGTARHTICERAGTALPIEPEVWDPKILATAELTPEEASAFAANVRDFVADVRREGTSVLEGIYVYNVVTDRARMSPHKRSKDDPTHKHDVEIRAIADLVVERADPEGGPDLTVYDYKTGRIENVDPADRNWQMLALGLAVARYHAADRVRVAVVEVDGEGRCRVASEATLEAWDLEEIARALRDLAVSVPTAQPTPGTWCRRKWCALAGLCPATVDVASKAIAPVLPEPPTEASYPIIATPLSATHAAYLLVVLDLVKAFGAELERNLKAYAKEHPIPTGAGRTWGPVLTPTTNIETSDAAIALLTSALGTHATEALGITKAGIERAAKLCTKRGEGAAKVREIMTALEAIGAVKQGHRTEYQETEASNG